MHRVIVAGSAGLAFALLGGQHVVLGSQSRAESDNSADVAKSPTSSAPKLKSSAKPQQKSSRTIQLKGKGKKSSKLSSAKNLRIAQYGGGNGGGAGDPNSPPQQSGRDGGTPPLPEQMPTFWTWQPPLGDDANNNSSIVRMVRRSCHKEPEQVANQIKNWILQKDLEQEQICVALMNFGHGGSEPGVDPNPFPALFQHWCDGLRHKATSHSTDCELLAPQDTVSKWWMTVWMSHGIAESRAWMERFIARYKEFQGANPDLPDPHRFHFDVERKPVPHVVGAVEVFDAMRNDPRWYTEPVPGFDGKTMEILYAEAGSPSYDVTRPFHHEPNLELVQWYMGVVRQACDGAMKAAVYDPLHAAFPNVKCSNYGTSDRYDGLGDPVRNWRSHQWGLESVYEGFGSMLAPVIYNVEPGTVPPGMTWQEGTVLQAMRDLDSNIHSYGANAWNIVPWIQTYGHEGLAKDGITYIYIDEALSRALLAVIRAKGVTEIALWSDGSTQDTDEKWTKMSRLIDEVWQMRLSSYQVTNGRDLTEDLEALRYSRRDPLQIESKRDESDVIATAMVATYHVNLDRAGVPDRMEIVVESSISEPVGEVTVALRNWNTGAFDLLTKQSMSKAYIALVDHQAPQHISWDGQIEVLVRHEGRSLFVASIDSIEVYPTGAGGTQRIPLASKLQGAY